VPAEVETWAVMPSTSGPDVHVKTLCVNRHWFLMPQEMLTRAEAPRADASRSVPEADVATDP
jgi:hypothetical protein